MRTFKTEQGPHYLYFLLNFKFKEMYLAFLYFKRDIKLDIQTTSVQIFRLLHIYIV